MQLPAQAARQLPDQSTTLRVDSSSTDDSRPRGALPGTDPCTAARCIGQADPEMPSAQSATNPKLIAHLANPSIREVDLQQIL
jgi:hypothetical protein